MKPSAIAVGNVYPAPARLTLNHWPPSRNWTFQDAEVGAYVFRFG